MPVFLRHSVKLALFIRVIDFEVYIQVIFLVFRGLVTLIIF